jgi:hypothetical protein
MMKCIFATTKELTNIQTPLLTITVSNMCLLPPKQNHSFTQVRGFTPIGIFECWNSGVMGSGKMECCAQRKKFQRAHHSMQLMKADSRKKHHKSI